MPTDSQSTYLVDIGRRVIEFAGGQDAHHHSTHLDFIMKTRVLYRQAEHRPES